MRNLFLTLGLFVMGFIATSQGTLASPFSATDIARDVPTNVQNVYWACRWGPYGRRCWWVRPYAHYRPYYRPYYYRPYGRRFYGYGY